MALKYESNQYKTAPNAPGTHALIIGVGDYPYLLGGVNEVPHSPFGLGQLTSSPVSAQAVCDWMLAEGSYLGSVDAGLKNTGAPLSTVDLLLTQAPGAAPVGGNIPTFDNIVTAVDNWIARCNQNEGNVAFIYLCGHGLKLRDLVFLASDFGDPALAVSSAWRRTISLDSIRLGMRKCNAMFQFMFFDCCRSYPVTFTEPYATGHQIFDSLMSHADNRNYVAMHSTLEGSQAFGAPNQPSYFTKALLEGLCGFASENRGSGWVVTNTSLSSAMYRIMRFDANVSINRQLVVSEAPGEAVLHELSNAPKVKARVKCQPPASPPTAVTLTLSRAGAPPYSVQGDLLRVDISPGEWMVAMQHGGGSQRRQQLITPPTFEQNFPYP